MRNSKTTNYNKVGNFKIQYLIEISIEYEKENKVKPLYLNERLKNY